MMKNNWLYAALLSFVLPQFVFLQCSNQTNSQPKLTDFFNKKNVTILVTDSGLGGLSITADLAKRLLEHRVFNHVNVVFFNALFADSSGYNSLPTNEEKIRIFDIALKTMAERYQPDMILIGCNTLSVLYDRTQFSASAAIPVIGIVDTGTELIARKFATNPAATVFIFGTETTIEYNSYQSRLEQLGYPKAQIVGQACPLLAGSIEEDYDGFLVTAMITEYVNQALNKTNATQENVFVSLNCTHYGYSIEQFKQIFADAGYPEIDIINPNSGMNDFIFKPGYRNRYPETTVRVEVISKTTISKEKIENLSSFLQNISPATEEALQNYIHDPELFDIQQK